MAFLAFSTPHFAFTAPTTNTFFGIHGIEMAGTRKSVLLAGI